MIEKLPSISLDELNYGEATVDNRKKINELVDIANDLVWTHAVWLENAENIKKQLETHNKLMTEIFNTIPQMVVSIAKLEESND